MSFTAIFEKINYYTYTYISSIGGNIIGNTTQTNEKGNDLEEVIAIPLSGYKFVQWDDGITTPSRRDLKICDDKIITAIFEPVGYQVSFIVNNYAHIDIYNPVDYSILGTNITDTISLDANTGTPTINNGHTLFKIVYSDLYFIKNITYLGKYDNLITINDGLLTDIIDIENIQSDLTINIIMENAKDIEVLNNMASKNLENGKIYFSWDILEGYDINNIDCIVTEENNSKTYKLGKSNSWLFEDGTVGKKYNFEFKPTSTIDNVLPASFFLSRYTLSENNLNVPMIEINTENYILPSFDKIYPPSGSWGAGITNNDYVQSHITIYDSLHNVVYESKPLSDDFSGSKIKIRGNTSAYLEKTPYKIKLDKKADLLSSFIDRLPNIDFRNKEWLLLNTGVGSTLNYMVGTETNRYLGAEYVPEYVYCALLINGDFKGVYLLTESISKNSSRVNVSDSGFIIENDAYWWNEDLFFESTFTSSCPTAYTFKYPDSDDIDYESEEYLYIKNYINQMEYYLLSYDETVFEYLDKESFAIWVLTHDFIGSSDSAGSNMYLTKYDSTDNSKICMGPTWDYDAIFATSSGYSNHHSALSFYFNILFEYDDFLSTYSNLYNEKKSNYKSTMDSIMGTLNSSNFDQLLLLDGIRWSKNNKTVAEQISIIDAWINDRIILLDSLLS